MVTRGPEGTSLFMDKLHLRSQVEKIKDYVGSLAQGMGGLFWEGHLEGKPTTTSPKKVV